MALRWSEEWYQLIALDKKFGIRQNWVFTLAHLLTKNEVLGKLFYFARQTSALVERGSFFFLHAGYKNYMRYIENVLLKIPKLLIHVFFTIVAQFSLTGWHLETR